MPLPLPPVPDAQRKRDDRERLGLMANSPKRSTQAQQDVDGLALFDAHRSPTLNLKETP